MLPPSLLPLRQNPHLRHNYHLPLSLPFTKQMFTGHPLLLVLFPFGTPSSPKLFLLLASARWPVPHMLSRNMKIVYKKSAQCVVIQTIVHAYTTLNPLFKA